MKKYYHIKNSASILLITIYISALLITIVYFFRILLNNKAEIYKINQDSYFYQKEVSLYENILKEELNNLAMYIDENNSTYIDENQFLENTELFSYGGYKLASDEKIEKIKKRIEQSKYNSKFLDEPAYVYIKFSKNVKLEEDSYELILRIKYLIDENEFPNNLNFIKITEIGMRKL